MLSLNNRRFISVYQQKSCVKDTQENNRNNERGSAMSHAVSCRSLTAEARVWCHLVLDLLWTNWTSDRLCFRVLHLLSIISPVIHVI